MERAIGTDFGGTVKSDRTAMSDHHARADLGIRMEINECDNGKQLSYDAKHQSRRGPKPSRAVPPNDLLEPVNCKRPKPF
jgi:hypothetical protein